MRIHGYTWTKYAAVFILLVFIDQLSKYFIRLKGGFYICNPGISWGIHVSGLFFWFFWLILIAFLLVALKKRYFMQNTLCIIFILSGAIANMIDRLQFGCVIDFIDLRFWPVFNLADILIVLGAFILLAGWKKI